MADKRITKDIFFNAYDILNTRINSTLSDKLTKLEKKNLFDFLYNTKDLKESFIKEPFIKNVLKGIESETQDEEEMDTRFLLPRIFTEIEEKFVKNKYSLKNSLSKVALSRAMLRFTKVSNIRIAYSTAKQPLRHVLLGR